VALILISPEGEFATDKSLLLSDRTGTRFCHPRTPRQETMENLSPDERAALQHWSTYGQKGKKPPHRVTPSEWKLEPFVKPITSDWSVAVAPHQLPTLLLGFLPGVKKVGFAGGRLA
jgi:hypothetical protein